MLIRAHQHSLFDNVIIHCLLHLFLIGPIQIRKKNIKRIEFMKIAMAAYRWTGTTITCSLPVVLSFQGTFREFTGIDPFC